MNQRIFRCAIGALLTLASARAGYVASVVTQGRVNENTFFDTASYNGLVVGSQFTTTGGGVQSGTTDTNGLATSVFEMQQISGIDAASSSSGYVNLATGKMGGVASAGPNVSDAIADESYSDLLHFAVSGAGSGTITDIGVSLTVDGVMSAGSLNDENQVVLLLNIDGNTMQIDIGQNLSGSVCVGSPCVYGESVAGNWVASSFSGTNPNSVTFTGVFALTGPTQDVPVSSELEVVASGADSVGTTDYSQTAAISLSLPQGVSFTSDSGVFLTQSTVPEPSAIWFAGAGLTVLGLLRRRAR